MKRPIEPADIRAGDLIRCEWKESDAAEEWRSPVDAGSTWDPAKVDHFLLDRPTPPVELPTEPTLGWIYANDERTLALVGVRKPGDPDYDSPIYIRLEPTGGWDRVKEISAFTSATAVPTDALDQLRGLADCSGPLSCLRRHVEVFLAAVDEANRA